MKLRHTILAGIACTGLAACGAEDTTDNGTGTEQPAVDSKLDQNGNPKADAWDARNDPDRLAQFASIENLQKNLFELPTKAYLATAAWTDTYWPTYRDSTNVQWQGKGTLSPLQKYDAAFNEWMVPANFTELRAYDPRNCTDGFDAEYYESQGPAARFMSENKGNKKARDLVYRNGADSEPVCDDETREAVETWWGLCHAWAPAAINEPEPIHPVTINGVTFYSADIKALIQTVYDRSNSRILGGRCNTKEPERDERGRIKDPACRDTNAGSFHLIMSNFLGIHNMALLEDRTYNYEVWNQPVVGFEVTQMTEIDVAKANELLGVEGDTYIYNDDAKRFAEVFATVKYITESEAEAEALMPVISRYTRSDNYKYILEMDADGNIIGGEWLQGRAQHSTWGVSEQPDFLWFSTGPAAGAYGSNPYVSYDKVKELIELSRRAPEGEGDETRKVYAFETATLIPDNDPAGVYMDLNVEDDFEAKSVKLQLDIEHTYVGDLYIELAHEDGFSVTIREKGTGGSAHDINELIDVPELAGKTIGGEWSLMVSDNARIDEGTVKRWALVVEAAE